MRAASRTSTPATAATPKSETSQRGTPRESLWKQAERARAERPVYPKRVNFNRSSSNLAEAKGQRAASHDPKQQKKQLKSQTVGSRSITWS
mmetsp:Transcript_42810/g.99741  ORF Transcript_42810/g.99741 Transcript_42810/m.99741 type:complete len:91 (-) Transcript_42810:46-318(-)